MKKINYTRGLALTIMLAFWFLPDASAQGYGDRNTTGDGKLAIQGKVFLPNGNPAAGVTVSYSGTEFVSGTARTDDSGNFRFSNLPPGNYTVTVRGTEAFETDTESVAMGKESSAGQSFTVVFNLRSKGTKKGDLSANPFFANVPKEALKKYQEAAESVKKNDLKAAVASLDAAIAIYPDFAFAYNEKGLLLVRQNELDKALEAYVKAIQIKPDYFDAKFNFGYALLNKKQYEQTEMIFRDLLKQKNDLPTAHMYLAIALTGLKKYDEAEAELKQAISLKGGENLAQAHRYLGGIYIQKNRHAEAISELQKYLELSPKAPDAEKLKAIIEDLKKKTN
ncbi:MAG TPA: tetratricopeptide repeat protein [Pyrinomonadaceae bacterium]|nr:tetratricopeptide repeat protein [Pyrinomonadaceae bacterium]